MVREICKDEAFLAQKAEPATADDLGVAQDLLDTLGCRAHGCSKCWEKAAPVHEVHSSASRSEDLFALP